MRNLLVIMILLAAFVLPASLIADSSAPHMRFVEPVNAQAGDIVTATGENLGASSIAALYLTDGKHDTKVVIIKETATSITFRVPPGTEPGRLALMVLTTGESPKLIEEPVRVEIQ